MFLSVLQHQVPPGGLVCVSLVPSRPPAETSGRNDVSNQRGLAGTSILIDFILFYFLIREFAYDRVINPGTVGGSSFFRTFP